MPERKNLAECTIYLLAHRDRKINLETIAKDCKLTKSWLSSLLSKDPPPHPSAVKIQRLYEYLTKKELIY